MSKVVACKIKRFAQDHKANTGHCLSPHSSLSVPYFHLPSLSRCSLTALQGRQSSMGNSLVTLNPTWLSLCTHPIQTMSLAILQQPGTQTWIQLCAHTRLWTMECVLPSLMTSKLRFYLCILCLCLGMKVEHQSSLDWFWMHFVIMQNCVPKWTPGKNPLFTILCICIIGCAYDYNQMH